MSRLIIFACALAGALSPGCAMPAQVPAALERDYSEGGARFAEEALARKLSTADHRLGGFIALEASQRRFRYLLDKDGARAELAYAAAARFARGSTAVEIVVEDRGTGWRVATLQVD